MKSSNNAAKDRTRKLWIFATLTVCVVTTFIVFTRTSSSKHQAGKASQAQPPVPIMTVTAKKGEIGVYIQALGTVTPITTVNAISRVQGQVMSVNYREGQTVNKGDSLIEIDSRPYEAAELQAEGALAHDIALLHEAKIDLVRYRKAYARNAIPKQQLDDQEQTVFQDEGTVKSDQGTLENARLNIAYCHIASPVSGKVGLRLLDPGNTVQANSTTPLVVITQLHPITVIFSVAEDYISQIQAQLTHGATMRVDAYDRSQEKKIASGTFLTLDNQVDTTTGTVKIRAIFPNDDNALFPNQFVNARLLVTTEKNETLISSAAIQRGEQGPFVYVVKDNKTVELRSIKVGATDEGETAVLGLNPDEVVVSNGFDKLKNGAKVTIKELAGEAAQP